MEIARFVFLAIMWLFNFATVWNEHAPELKARMWLPLSILTVAVAAFWIGV